MTSMLRDGLPLSSGDVSAIRAALGFSSGVKTLVDADMPYSIPLNENGITYRVNVGGGGDLILPPNPPPGFRVDFINFGTSSPQVLAASPASVNNIDAAFYLAGLYSTATAFADATDHYVLSGRLFD